MNTARPSPVAALLALALSACGGLPQWDKPGADAAAVQADSEQCRAQARVAPTPAHPIMASDPNAAVVVTTREDQLALNETAEFQKCMRDKGYSAKR